MNIIFDRASAARLPEPRLRSIIERRIDALGDLMNWTEIYIIEPGDTEADIIREVGFSPLVEPAEDLRFGCAGFMPFWDHLVDCGGWFELSISFGSSFAYMLFIADADGVPRDLLSLCRTYASI